RNPAYRSSVLVSVIVVPLLLEPASITFDAAYPSVVALTPSPHPPFPASPSLFSGPQPAWSSRIPPSRAFAPPSTPTASSIAATAHSSREPRRHRRRRRSTRPDPRWPR